jgi:hypothetical protein
LKRYEHAVKSLIFPFFGMMFKIPAHSFLYNADAFIDYFTLSSAESAQTSFNVQTWDING